MDYRLPHQNFIGLFVRVRTCVFYNAPEEGIQLERWGELPEIQENEGDDQSIDSLEISEPDIDVPEAPTPEPAPAPAPAASRPTRDATIGTMASNVTMQSEYTITTRF